ncbi:MAG: hypothetical protein GF384_02545 [Elusimicrobia bacterium]|nr:hypothetical protein [Elusimicrobiota bacterium]
MNVRSIIMNVRKVKKSLYNQTPLKLLSYLSIYPEKIFSAYEVSRHTHTSKGATNQILRLFVKLDILIREKRGNVFLYKLNIDNFILKQFKIFENLLSIQDIIKAIKPYCYQIIIFGSCADGSNSVESDIDLFIKSEFKNQITKAIADDPDMRLKIKPIIQDPLEIISAEKKDKVFFEQVKKGIVLWEGKPTHEEV